MSADTLLSQLDKVRATGQTRWVACCPAHEDKSPSLAIREVDDGRVLVHCFSGCATEDVLAAVGLTFSDLFAPRETNHHGKPERRPFPAADVLRCLFSEGLVIASSGRSVMNGTWKESDQARLVEAVGRVAAGMTAAGVHQ